jgi:hypothetical protein
MVSGLVDRGFCFLLRWLGWFFGSCWLGTFGLPSMAFFCASRAPTHF